MVFPFMLAASLPLVHMMNRALARPSVRSVAGVALAILGACAGVRLIMSLT